LKAVEGRSSSIRYFPGPLRALWIANDIFLSQTAVIHASPDDTVLANAAPFRKGDFEMLLIEIVLAVTAWRRGWKGRALLPFAFVLPVIFIAGVLAGPAGVHGGSFIVASLMGDVAIIGALTYMVRRPRAISAGAQTAAPLCAPDTSNHVKPRAA
jgi:hypothetical protein